MRNCYSETIYEKKDILVYIQLFRENENQRNIFKNSGILLSYDMLRQRCYSQKMLF